MSAARLLHHTATHMHQPTLSTELALRAFEADAQFSAALAQLQPQLLGVSTAAALVAANEAGFCWLFRPVDATTTEAVLRHAGGSEEKAIGYEPLPLLLGLLGVLDLPQEAQAADPEPAMQETHTPEPEPVSALDSAAESLAAATDGVVIKESAEAAARAADDPLSDEEKAAAVAMVKAMTVEQRKSFTIAFRHAFRVPSSEKAVAPLLVQFRHLEFVDRFTGEAAGVPKP